MNRALGPFANMTSTMFLFVLPVMHKYSCFTRVKINANFHISSLWSTFCYFVCSNNKMAYTWWITHVQNTEDNYSCTTKYWNQVYPMNAIIGFFVICMKNMHVDRHSKHRKLMDSTVVICISVFVVFSYLNIFHFFSYSHVRNLK